MSDIKLTVKPYEIQTYITDPEYKNTFHLSLFFNKPFNDVDKKIALERFREMSGLIEKKLIENDA